MQTVVLKTHDDAPDMSAKKLIQFARKKVRQNRKQSYEMISLIQSAWSLPRPIAAAVLFSEVRLRTVGDDDSQEFNWPVDTEVTDE
jgi:hypothetical protein